MQLTGRLSLVSALLLFTFAFFTRQLDQGLFIVSALIALSIAASLSFRQAAYTLWILSAVAAAMYYPQYFLRIGEFELKKLIVPLLQVIMFGMGTAMSVNDFVGIVKTPKAVGIGLLCQLSIMPIVGFTIAGAMSFPPEIAAGIILVGCSPSGLASNVMAYIAKTNLALSVTLTAIATLLSPIVTPLLMKTLAGEYIEIELSAMIWSITKIVILPIIAGLIFNRLFHGKMSWLDKTMPLVSMGGIALIIVVITAAGREHLINIGLLLILAAFIHNIMGYVLGYSACAISGLDKKSCRTIAFEVGMQNTGLASGIALGMGKVATLGLAPSVFGPLMNVTGSCLASYWKTRSNTKNVSKKIE